MSLIVAYKNAPPPIGIKVSVPIRSSSGKHLEQVNINGTIYNIVVFEKAPGQKVNIKNPEEWNEKFWETMGRVMGSLHHVSVKFNQVPALKTLS